MCCHRRVLVVLTEHLSAKADVLVGLWNRAKQEQPGGIAPGLVSRARPPRQVQRRFNAAEAVKIAEQYLAGQTMKQLARAYGVHRGTVAHCLQKQGVALRQPGLAPEHLE